MYDRGRGLGKTGCTSEITRTVAIGLSGVGGLEVVILERFSLSDGGAVRCRMVLSVLECIFE